MMPLRPPFGISTIGIDAAVRMQRWFDLRYNQRGSRLQPAQRAGCPVRTTRSVNFVQSSHRPERAGNGNVTFVTRSARAADRRTDPAIAMSEEERYGGSGRGLQRLRYEQI